MCVRSEDILDFDWPAKRKSLIAIHSSQISPKAISSTLSRYEVDMIDEQRAGCERGQTPESRRWCDDAAPKRQPQPIEKIAFTFRKCEHSGLYADSTSSIANPWTFSSAPIHLRAVPMLCR